MMFDDDVVAISGGGNGIGLAAARRFAELGASVAILDIDPDVGARAAESLGTDFPESRFEAYRADVGDGEQVRETFERIKSDLGVVSVLYCNAGGTSPLDGRLGDVDEGVLWSTLRRDLGGVWNCCRAALPGMVAAGKGAIVNASSMTALIGRDGADSYTAAKGAVASLTRSLAVEYAADGIRVNAVAPGATLSPRVRARLEAGRFPQQLLDRHLHGLLEPVDIANVVVFLASDNARGLTGQVLAVDSGASIS
jgi:NAD(P)-dependent dehydrogenase (short-subunit alcohol dehydrogenase family)